MAILNGTGASEILKGTQVADTINGLGGNDRLVGYSGNDILNGGDGNDILVGGGGKDTLTGGAGADEFAYISLNHSLGAWVDLITDFNASEGDTVNILGVATFQPSYNPSFTGLQAIFVYDTGTNTTTLTYYQGSTTPVFQLKFTGHVEYDQSAFPTILPNPFGEPTEGKDILFGTPNADIIDLLGGDDSYYAGGGDDSVAGGSGNDYIAGEDGNDNLRGGSGADLIDGGAGNDILYGGTEDDELRGFIGNDTLYGGGGNDLISDGPGDDFVWGQSGDDRMQLGTGNDRLNGGDGYDIVLANLFSTETFSSFSITKANGSIILTDTNASDGIDFGTDTLIHVEAIQFADGIYVVATDTFMPF